jgi:2-succinyl-6-hydroxy-2,4-cyclohexadiene-1-carboxylate synthase
VRALLLHGFAGTPAAWDAAIAAGLEGKAIALPGHGGGPVRDTWEANLAAIDTRGATLAIGYSFGARVALGLLAANRIERAILIGVNPGIPDEERAIRRVFDARWAALLRTEGIAAFVDAWEAQSLFATQTRVDPARLAARRAQRLALDPEELARSLEVMGLAEMPDYRGVVTAERCTLMVGADDTKFLAIARTLPARLELIGGAGHDVPLEQPATLAAAITRTVRAGDPGS